MKLSNALKRLFSAESANVGASASGSTVLASITVGFLTSRKESHPAAVTRIEAATVAPTIGRKRFIMSFRSRSEGEVQLEHQAARLRHRQEVLAGEGTGAGGASRLRKHFRVISAVVGPQCQVPHADGERGGGCTHPGSV